MSKDSIYVRFKGKTLGPLTAEKVQGLVSRGQITRMHELSSDGMTWFRAEEFGDFFRSKSSKSDTGVNHSQSTVASRDVGASKQAAQGETVEWYANVDGEMQGPMAKNALLAMIEDERVVNHTLVWRTGLDDWQDAETLFPERFRQKNSQSVSAINQVVQGTNSQMQLISNVILGSRGWVMFIAIFTIISAVLMILNAVFLLVASRGFAALVGVGNLVAGFIYLYGGILLLQYGNSLKISPSERNVNILAAMKRLSMFWSYVGFVLAIMLTIGVVGGVVFALIGSAAVTN